MKDHYDVAIIGGGPAGNTCGTFLRKYNPNLRVLILERERFPRDHVGESQLPVICQVLDEMGVWDKVERANFPVKIGATYRWGRTDDLWDFEFIEGGLYQSKPRPGKYVGQRRNTAFQVDRGIYDKILLDHSKEMGCEVREQTAVREVKREGDRVTGLVLADGSQVTARYYVDGSGSSGILRRAMDIGIDCPTKLRNIAIWDYWQNAEWATTVGGDATRILIMSKGYGWLWFIPLGPTRTSLGLVVPAEYYKNSGKKPRELYEEAIRTEPMISRLIENATSEERLTTTKDWSFVSDRLVGENWFLAGETCGFADPILSAGMSLAHVGGRDIAYTIMALDKGEYEAEWLKSRYDETHRHQIRNHIRFADFWYTHSGVFTDIYELTKEIAGEQGLNMTASEAWQWFGQGGFIDHNAGVGFGGYSLTAARIISANLAGDKPYWEAAGKTHFKINLEGSTKEWTADLSGGQLIRRRCYKRGCKFLPAAGIIGWLIQVLKTERSFEELSMEAAKYAVQQGLQESQWPRFRYELMDAIEAMLSDEWIVARTEPNFQAMPPAEMDFSYIVHDNEDMQPLQA